MKTTTSFAASFAVLSVFVGCTMGESASPDSESSGKEGEVVSGADGGAAVSPGSNGGGGGGASAASGLPCDVEAVLKKGCAECHGATPSYGAPMPLVTFADLTAPAKSNPSKKVYEMVGTRVHDESRPMPQAPNPRLSAADTATLDTWIAARNIASTVKSGDTIRTRCAWNNTTGADVKFGENTDDEMCWSFTMYYPRVTTPLWNWALPSATSKCKPH